MPAATPLPRGPSVLTLYSADDLLTGPGCPVCGYVIEAADRHLGWFALEAHAQPTTITRLCASLGMCAAHTRALMSQPGSAIRLTAVYRYVITDARDRLAGRSGRQAACPACEHDDSAAKRALDTLAEGLADIAVLERCRELGGLCLPHLTAMAAIVRPRLVAPLAETMRDTIAADGPRCGWLAGTDHDARTRAQLRALAPPAGSSGPVACSPCLAGVRAERDALARLPDMVGGDPELPPMLCAGHLADAAAAAGDPGIGPLLTWQARSLTSVPRARSARRSLRRSRRDLSGGCAICHARQTASQRVLADLRACAHDADATLCVRHHLVLRDANPCGARGLAGGAIDRADQLAVELSDAFDRAARAHARGSPAPESTAWRRAAAFLDGSVFCGWSWPLPTGWPREHGHSGKLRAGTTRSVAFVSDAPRDGADFVGGVMVTIVKLA